MKRLIVLSLLVLSLAGCTKEYVLDGDFCRNVKTGQFANMELCK